MKAFEPKGVNSNHILYRVNSLRLGGLHSLMNSQELFTMNIHFQNENEIKSILRRIKFLIEILYNKKPKIKFLFFLLIFVLFIKIFSRNIKELADNSSSIIFNKKWTSNMRKYKTPERVIYFSFSWNIDWFSKKNKKVEFPPH